MSKELLLIFIKNPVFGKVKTRLAATVGPEKALAVYNELLHRTQIITQNLPYAKALYYSDFIAQEDTWDSAVYAKHRQEGINLGARMLQAFATGFAAGYSSICIIGSDCYELTSAIIQNAFNQLQQKEVVLGPAKDGGYYLLGMNKLHPFLFQNKSWSSPLVMEQTLQDLNNYHLTVALLPTLTDVDEEKDLPTIAAIPCP